MRACFVLLLAVLTGMAAMPAHAADKARHVVVVVWDGMRPDFITQENSPTLFQLAQSGVRFDNHHPVYMSATEVNGTAIATGDYPAHDGLIANKEFRPEIDPLKPFHTEDTEMVRKGDEVTHGHYLRARTIAELLRQRGMRTAIAGAKPVALLHDRFPRVTNSWGINLFAGETLPPEMINLITNTLGPFPGTNNTHVTRNDWTTQALTDYIWQNGVPEFSLLWLNQPDFAQHRTGPGSAQSLEAIKNADDNLARLLHALEQKHVREQTDILLISDHGFSTVLSIVDLAESLKTAGFRVTREFKSPPVKGDVLVSGNGGSVLLYVTGHDTNVVNNVVRFLQNWSYTGVIFTRQPLPGTFTLAQAHLDSTDAPDIFISMRWNGNHNEVGTPGMLVCDVSPYVPGQGMHGSLSAFDMHNTFVAAGPDFRSGVVDRLPTGNLDIAPTILWILGVKPVAPMDGRVVTEALVGNQSNIKSYEPNHIEASRALEKMVWHQYLNFSEVNGVMYFDEGNGFQTSK